MKASAQAVHPSPYKLARNWPCMALTKKEKRNQLIVKLGGLFIVGLFLVSIFANLL